MGTLTRIKSALSRPFYRGAMAFAAASFLSLSFLSLAPTILGPQASPPAYIFSLLLVLTAGPVNFLLAFVLYPMVEDPICSIPLLVVGWTAAAVLAGVLVSKCVKGSGPVGYAVALFVSAVIHLPFAFMLTILLDTG